jgi:hypothetical protein
MSKANNFIKALNELDMPLGKKDSPPKRGGFGIGDLKYTPASISNQESLSKIFKALDQEDLKPHTIGDPDIYGLSINVGGEEFIVFKPKQKIFTR